MPSPFGTAGRYRQIGMLAAGPRDEPGARRGGQFTTSQVAPSMPIPYAATFSSSLPAVPCANAASGFGDAGLALSLRG